MYAMMRRRGGQEVLIEISATEFKQIVAADDGRQLTQVDAATARRWVADGGQHSTPLYVDIYDSGKVRYAKDRT